MKLVGAKKSFIRKPFLVQGMFQGLLSGIFSVALLSLTLFFIRRDLNPLYMMLDEKLILLVLAGIIVLGVLICLISTFFVVNKIVTISSEEIYY
jgi:cell division transport system permease protein